MNPDPASWRPLLRAPREQRWRRQRDTGTGRGVRIGILDTGVDDRLPELQGAIRSHHAIGWGRRFRPVRRGRDEIGHGTACAWIIRQLAPEAELHSVRVIGRSPREKGEKLVAGWRLAIDQGWDVINISLGSTGFREPLSELARECGKRGIVVVAAANNDPGRESYPAALPGVIGVDAGSFDEVLGFRYEAARPIEVEANGVYIRAPRPDGTWFHYTGSSFACPHVTALAARLWEPGLGVEGFRRKLEALGESGESRVAPSGNVTGLLD